MLEYGLATKDDIEELIQLRIDLKATDDGYPIYEKVGFKEVEARYREMRYEL